mgnify:CR=1 FL=1
MDITIPKLALNYKINYEVELNSAQLDAEIVRYGNLILLKFC